MTARPKLTEAPAPFEAQFSDSGALRQSVGATGRVHIDRWLPFLVIHRGVGDGDSLARRVAVDSPSYLIWSPEDDHAALSALEAIAEGLAERSGSLLLFELSDRVGIETDAKSDKLTPFVADLASSGGADVERAAGALETALKKIEIDLRRCKVDREPLRDLLPPAFEHLLDSNPRIERIQLAAPQIHRQPDGGTFPGLLHDLSVALGDTILRTACVFLDTGKTGKAPRHFRELGRSSFVAAALKADRKLDAVARSFDFLLSISPIDTSRALERFLEDGAEKAPRFHYRPLSVDPDLAKRDLYSIDLRSVEDPLLETLLSEKRREIDAQLTMLATRNTPAFRPASIMLYGAVDAALLADAHSILESTAKDPPRGAAVGAQEIAAAATDLIDQYRASDDRFDATVEIRDDVAGLLVSRGRLLIGSDSLMPARRLDALLAHEVSVHLLTYFNGAAQGLSVFRSGLAGYEGLQEGLGVFAEWALGGLTRTRLRLIAGRVVAVDAMLRGASFIEVWRILHGDHRFTRQGAFGIAARVFRSGGLAKDAIYLQGFRAVIDLVSAGASLNPYWLGKIAPRHAPAIDELLGRGLLRKPIFIPSFLDDEPVRARISALRKGGSFNDLITGV